MNDSELNEVFSALVEVLRRAGLGWMVEQVDEAIESGRLVTKVVRRGQADEVEALQLSTKATSRTVVGTEPYSARERLQLLIDAVRLAIRDSSALERSVHEFLNKETERGEPETETRAPLTSAVLLSAPDRETAANPTTIAGGEDRATGIAERALPLLDELERSLDET